MRILGISGSLRQDSHNTRLLRAAGDSLPGGVELELLDPALLKAVPPYDEDDEARAAGEDIDAVQELKASIADADAILFATPEYNGSIPGALKNALDWVSRPMAGNPLRGKPVAVVGASTGLFGAVWAQAELRKVLSTIGADVVDRELPVGQAHDVWGEDGQPQDEALRSELVAHVGELIAAAPATV